MKKKISELAIIFSVQFHIEQTDIIYIADFHFGSKFQYVLSMYLLWINSSLPREGNNFR